MDQLENQMKKLFLLSIAIFWGAFLSAQETAKLSGTITNPQGDQVYLYTIVNQMGRRVKVDLDSSAVDAKGNFSLEAAVDSTMNVTFYDGNEQMSILLSPGDEQYVTLNTKYFDETMRFSGKGSEKNNAIVVLYMIDEAFSNNFFQELERDDVDTTALFSAYDLHSESVAGLISDYVASIPDFKMHGEQMLKMEDIKKKQIKAYAASQIEFNKHLKTIVGKPAVDFEGIDLEGAPIKLSDFKGKIIVVDFWATWCGPCKAEFPAYKELEAQYGEEVHFVSVGAYCDQEGWKKMATEEGFKNNIFLSKEAEAQIADYKVNFIPRYLVIDEEFKLIDANAPRPSSGELQSYWLK